jgi:long-chain acyl-CoA synthetase
MNRRYLQDESIFAELHLNLALWLKRAALADPARPALFRGCEVARSYGQLADRVARLAGGLRARLGLPVGSRVALWGPNSIEYIESLLAIWHSGLVAVPINFRLHSTEVGYILADCDASAVLIDKQLSSESPSERRCIPLGGADFESLLTSEALPLADRNATDLAWIFYTSGTTGRPKGVMLNQRNLLQMSLAYIGELDPVAREDVLVHAAPLSHGSGFYLLPHLLAGARQAVPQLARFEAEEIASIATNLRQVTLFAAPTMVSRLSRLRVWTEDAVRGVKSIIYGGGPMYAATQREALQQFGCRLAQIYGQGECPMTITRLTKLDHQRALATGDYLALASVGRPFSAIELQIDSKDGSAGEVLVRGDAVMEGYWGLPDATQETVRGGWLHTGDVGKLDARGFLTLIDRSKDTIISGGSNIYPREVEEVLMENPQVREVSVVGRPDEEWGEAVVAFVVPVEGGSVTAESLDAWCIDHIARYKRPRVYRFVRELPKNENGKVLKRELRASLEEAFR